NSFGRNCSRSLSNRTSWRSMSISSLPARTSLGWSGSVLARRSKALARATSSWMERLGQVVVGAHLEADDLVRHLVASSQHDDRHLAQLANLLADGETVGS